MVYLLLGITALTATLQNILKKLYNKRCAGGVYCFCGLVSFFAMLFFLAVNRDWSYPVELLLPSFAFAVSYAVATVFAVLAIRYGSLAISSLVISCSLLIPSFYGIVCLGEPISATLFLGTAFLIVALILVNYEKKQDKLPRIRLKWVFFLFLAFLGNGMCSTVQKAEALFYGKQGENCFMIVALAMVSLMMLVLTLCVKEERQCAANTLKKGWLLALLSGVFNGLTNYLVLYLNPRLPASVMFPVISAGGLILVFLYSFFIERERFNVWQKVGFFVGLASIVLLNL